MTPELLADVLGRIVAERGLVVMRLRPVEKSAAAEGAVEDDRLEEAPTGVDVALVCGPVPVDVNADVVVYLPEDAFGRGVEATDVLVVGPKGRGKVAVADVDALVDLLVELAIDL